MATESIENCLGELRTLLLQLKPTGDDGFEGLLATTLSEFSGLTIRLAKSGSQFGRDGRSPSAPFAIAMEAKRYTEELGLEVLAKAAVASHVLSESVDVWAVGATSEIGDETLEKLTDLFEERGMTFLAFDWAARPLPSIAVLFAATHETSIGWFRKNGRCDVAKFTPILGAITGHPSYGAQVLRLREEVTAGKVGLDALRTRGEEWLSQRLRQPLASQIAFGQYLTVADPNWPAVARPAPLEELTRKASFTSTCDRPVVVAVLGPEGVGKSWLVAQWWAALAERPIMAIVAGHRVEELSSNEALENLARLLAAQVPCTSHDPSGGWLRRLRRWKTQRFTGHLRFVIAVDGLNERPTRPWADIIKGLANEVQSLGGLVIATSRSAYWHGSVRPKLPDGIEVRTVEVPEFDDEEIASAVQRAGIFPFALPQKVREFMRNPRVCALAIKLIDRLMLQPAELTIDRLLFEYWRQRLEERGDLIKHNIGDFDKLIRSHASAWLAQPSRSFERDEWDVHSGAARRLGPSHVIDDVTEIEEGRFMRISRENNETYEFRSEALPYALALLVNSELKNSKTGETPLAHLDRILDPVRGFGIVAEVIEASVRLACLDTSFPNETRAALVRAWMGSQNADYTSSDAMSAYVRACPTAFLVAAELPQDSTHQFIHYDLLLALLVPSRDAQSVQDALSRRLPKWLAQWSRRSRTSFGQDIDEKRQAERDTQISTKLASLTAQELALFRCITVEEPYASAIALDGVATRLIAGRPLAPHAEGILGWAFARTIAADYPDSFESLAWVVRLNPVDARATHDAMISLLKGIDASSSEWVRSAAATALHLLGTRESAQAAEQLDLTEAATRWRRAELFCDTNPHDPSASQCSNFENARAAAKGLNPLAVWSSSMRSIEDSDLEEVTTALARFDQACIVEVLRSVAVTAPVRTGVGIRSLSWNLVGISPLFDERTIQMVRAGYDNLLCRPATDTPDSPHVALWFARSLMPHLAAEQQLELLFTLPRESQLRFTLRDSIRPLPPYVLEERLEVAVAAPDHQDLRGILFFAAGSKPALTARARTLIATCLMHTDELVRACASECVVQAQDSELDKLMLNCGRVETTINDSFLEQYRDAAEAQAIAAVQRQDLAHRVSPRVLGFVAKRIGGQALELFSDCLDRIVSSLLIVSDVAQPEDLEICVAKSENTLPGRYEVIDKAEDSGSTEFPGFVADINDPESAARRLSERRRAMNERAAAYVKELSARGMAEVVETPPQWGLEELVSFDPLRFRSWLERILSTEDPRTLRQICNLAVSLARVYANRDPALSARIFLHFRDCEPILHVKVEPEEIPLLEYSLFSTKDSEAMETLKISFFARASNDADLEMVTVAAEVCGQREWLDRYIDGLLKSSHPADQARGITILGFRQPNAVSERFLGVAQEHGFLGQVTQFAFENYQHATWTRHWLACLERAEDKINFWRYGILAQTICDLRFLRVFPKVTASDFLYAFGTDLYSRMKKEAKERSKKRRETLFGLKAPEAEIVEAIKDGLRPRE